MKLDVDLSSNLPTRHLEYIDRQAGLIIAKCPDRPATVAVFVAIRDAVAAEVRRRGLAGIARPMLLDVILDADADPDVTDRDLRYALACLQVARDSGGSPEACRAVWGELAGDLMVELDARRRQRAADRDALAESWVKAG